MPTDDHLLPLVFRGGVDTKTDDKQVVQAKLLDLKNGVFTAPGRVDLRFGNVKNSSSISGGGAIASGQMIDYLSKEIYLVSSDLLYRYDTYTPQWVPNNGQTGGFGTANKVFSAQADNVGIFNRSGFTTDSYDSSIIGDYVYYFWSQNSAGTGTQLWVTVLNKNTNDVVLPSTQVQGTPVGTILKSAVMGTLVYLFAFRTDNTIVGLIFDPLNITVMPASVQVEASAGFGTVPTAGMSTAFPFDIYVVGSNIALASKDNSGSKFLRLRVLDSALNSVAVGSASAGPAVYTFSLALSYGFTAGKYILACTFQTSSTVGSIQYSEITVVGAVATFSAFTTVSALGKMTHVGIVVPSVASFVICADQAFSSIVATDLGNERYHTLHTYLNTGSHFFKPSACLVSKPFMVGDEVRVIASYDSSTQSTFFVIDPTKTYVIAKCFYGNAGGKIPHTLPSVNMSSASIAVSAAAKRVLNGDGTTRLGVSGLYFSFNNTDRNWKTEHLDASSIISGAVLSAFDGDVVREHGFLLAPQISGIAVVGGGTLPAGTYQVYAVFEYSDRYGQIYQSAPSNSLSIVLSGVQDLLFTVDMLNFTNDPRLSTTSGVSIVAYSTLANQITPYRTTSVVQNFPGNMSTTLGFFGTVSASNQILYTFGGTLPNSPTINCSLIGRFKNRVMLGGCDDENQVFFSKERLSGEPVNFSQALSINIPAVSSGVTAFIQMDDRIIFFKKDRIFFVYGDGPDDTGANDTFSVPSELVTPVGCAYPKSVVLFPGGIMFKSEKGIWALDRSLGVNYIGADVEAYNASKVTSAVLLETQNLVRFTLDSGVRLTYDYFVGQWSVDTGINAVTAINWNGSYTWLKSDGGVYKESSSVYTDDGAAVSLTVETAWIKLIDLNGFQRIKRAILLGSYFTAHTVTVSVAYDYGAYEKDYVYTPAAINPEQFEMHLAKQKCESIKFKIVVTFAGSPGRGCNISGLSLLAGMKRGGFKLPKTQKVS